MGIQRLGCEWWHRRWNETRRRALAGQRSFIQFVHVPKAAGHTIEAALKLAFHGCADNATCAVPTSTSVPLKRCGIETSDCQNYHGGHHALVHRNGGSFITVLREPMSCMISAYNDVGSVLSRSCFGIHIQYCMSDGYKDFCQPGTGTNLHRMMADGRDPQKESDVVPCVAAKPFLEWAEAMINGTADRLAFRRTQSYWVQQRDNIFHPRDFVLVGIATPQSVAAFIERLHHVYNTPFDPTPLVDRPPAPATPQGSSSNSFKPFSSSSLTAEDRRRLTINPLFQRDQLSFANAQAIDDEQQHCFRTFVQEA